MERARKKQSYSQKAQPPGGTSGRDGVEALWEQNFIALQRRCRFHARGLKNANVTDLEVEDLAQEFLLFVWTIFGKFDPRLGAFSTWSEHVLKGRRVTLLRYYGAQRRRGIRADEFPEPSVEPTVKAEEFWIDLAKPLRKLSPEAHTAIKSLAIYPKAEICVRSGRSLSWLSAAIATSRQRMLNAGLDAHYFAKGGRN